MEIQPQTGIRVLLAGASGLVGGHCLTQLLADDGIAHITVVARRALAQAHPKLTVQVVDFDHLREQAGAIRTDAALCCLGTTHRAAGSPEAFAKVDHIYVAELAKLAAAAGAMRFVLLSAVVADAASPIFYNRPVSYTHLDVYKRQGPPQAVPQLGERFDFCRFSARFGWTILAEGEVNRPVQHVEQARFFALLRLRRRWRSGGIRFGFCLLYTSRCV